MAGLVPAIQVFLSALLKRLDARDNTRRRASRLSPGMTRLGLCCAANMHRSSSVRPLSFGASVLYMAKGGKATLGGNPHGHDDERRSPACGAAPDGVGKAQRSRSAE